MNFRIRIQKDQVWDHRHGLRVPIQHSQINWDFKQWRLSLENFGIKQDVKRIYQHFCFSYILSGPLFTFFLLAENDEFSVAANRCISCPGWCCKLWRSSKWRTICFRYRLAKIITNVQQYCGFRKYISFGSGSGSQLITDPAVAWSYLDISVAFE